jgi:hypothetical protein
MFFTMTSSFLISSSSSCRYSFRSTHLSTVIPAFITTAGRAAYANASSVSYAGHRSQQCESNRLGPKFFWQNVGVYVQF